MPVNRQATNVVRTLPPKKAIGILSALISDAAQLEGEPFGSPKRDQWAITSQAALERAFGRDSSIVASFGASQAIAYNVGDSNETLRRIANEQLSSEVSVLQSAVQQLNWADEFEEDIPGPTGANAARSTILVFVSHSSKDEALAKALIDLLRSGVGLPANQIRCSSVDGYRLPVGVDTEGKLREEVNAAKVAVGLITPSSLTSHFVMFELGARWGSRLFVAPLLAGVAPSELKGPLSLLNAISADTQSKLIQFVEDIARQLGIRPQSAASYLNEVSAVLREANAIPKTGAALITIPEKPTMAALRQENDTLNADNVRLREQLRLKGTIMRINGHTYVEGDDAEMCPRCLAVQSLAVPLQDMNLDGIGMKATCPQCKMPRGKFPPIPRKQAEETARRIAEESESH